MAFSKLKNVPEVQEAVAKLEVSAQKYSQLLESGTSEDKTAAQKVWQEMAPSYWEILFAIIDANTKNSPAQLNFDEEEKLFIDLGCVKGILPLSNKFDVKNYFSEKCAPDIFPVMTFSDYISECWASITSNPIPTPSIGMTLKDRLAGLNDLLAKTQSERNKFFTKIASEYPSKVSTKQTLDLMTELLIPAMKVIMRVPEFREGSEAARQKLSQQRKAYIDAENAALLLVSSAQKNQEKPLPLKEYEKFMALHNRTRILSKKILYTQIDEVKIARRIKKISDNCAAMSNQMRRGELKAMLVSKREYVPAKNARCDASFLCKPDSMPVDHIKDYNLFGDFTACDIDMFSVPRVRMYGIPRLIYIPGQGLGTYDWSDNTLLVPMFPTSKEGQAVAYALGTFRWDSDEDRKVRTPYEGIKENKKKSVLAMAASFYKDYSIWMTKERLGYRIMPRETHKVFSYFTALKMEE